MKNIIIAVLLVAVLGGGIYLWQGPDRPASLVKSNNAGRPTKAAVISTNISFSVTVAGEIGPAEQVSVRPEVNGRISEMPVDIGDSVKKDQLLFSLDDKDLRIELDTRKQEIESAQLQLDKARLRMEQAERDFVRDESLHQENLVSAQVFETSRQAGDAAKKDFELAQNSVARAQSNYDLAEERMTKTRVKAPFDCTVLTRPISAVGQAVSGSGGFNSGTEVMTIANLNDLVILAHVNQGDVTRLKTGMTVQVAVEAVANLVVTGIVERISPQATIVHNIKGFSTRIRLENPDARIQPGMTASITIPVASVSNVIAVPLAAVFTEFNPEIKRNERFVYVEKEARFEKRPVQIGVADYFNAEIQEGLSPGDVVSLEKPDPELVDESTPIQAEGGPKSKIDAGLKST